MSTNTEETGKRWAHTSRWRVFFRSLERFLASDREPFLKWVCRRITDIDEPLECGEIASSARSF